MQFVIKIWQDMTLVASSLLNQKADGHFWGNSVAINEYTVISPARAAKRSLRSTQPPSHRAQCSPRWWHVTDCVARGTLQAAPNACKDIAYAKSKTQDQSIGQEDFLDQSFISPYTPHSFLIQTLGFDFREHSSQVLMHLHVSIYNPHSKHCPISAAREGERCRWGQPFHGGLDALQLALAYRSQGKTLKTQPGWRHCAGSWGSHLHPGGRFGPWWWLSPCWAHSTWQCRHCGRAGQADEPAQLLEEQLQTNFVPHCSQLGLFLVNQLCCWLMAFGDWHGKWDFTERQGTTNWNDKIILVVH